MEFEQAAAAWAARQQELLDLEAHEEEVRTSGALAVLTAAELEAQGTTISRAIMGGAVLGSFGRTMVRLEPPPLPKGAQSGKGDSDKPGRASRPVFPPHRLRPGSLVGLCLFRDDATARACLHPVRGVVSRSSDTRIEIALDESSTGGGGGDTPAEQRAEAQIEAVIRAGAVVRLDTIGSDISGDRLRRAVADVGAGRWWAAEAVGRALFAAGPDAETEEASAKAAAAAAMTGDAATAYATAPAASLAADSGADWPAFAWSRCDAAAPDGAVAAPSADESGAEAADCAPGEAPVPGETAVPAPALSAVRRSLFRQDLNAPQLRAVARCLASADVHLVHGPPGTGKTTTVAEIVRQLVARGLRVLACAPSNVAVDNLAERLAEPAAEPDGCQGLAGAR